MDELIGIVIFSGFMLVVVALLLGNLLVAVYRERKQRKADPAVRSGSARE